MSSPLFDTFTEHARHRAQARLQRWSVWRYQGWDYLGSRLWSLDLSHYDTLDTFFKVVWSLVFGPMFVLLVFGVIHMKDHTGTFLEFSLYLSLIWAVFFFFPMRDYIAPVSDESLKHLNRILNDYPFLSPLTQNWLARKTILNGALGRLLIQTHLELEKAPFQDGQLFELCQTFDLPAPEKTTYRKLLRQLKTLKKIQEKRAQTLKKKNMRSTEDWAGTPVHTLLVQTDKNKLNQTLQKASSKSTISSKRL